MSCINSKFNTYFESFASFNKDESNINSKNNLNNNNNSVSNQNHSPKNVKIDGAYYTDIPTQGGYSESLNQAIFKRQFTNL